MNISYNKQDLVSSWKKLKIQKGDTVYLAGNLLNLGSYFNMSNILEDYYTTLLKAVGKNGTLVFPTHSWKIKEKKFFHPENTPSECGALSEYLRLKKNSFRHCHPLSSVSAIGKMAKFVTKFETKHAYGPGSPFEKLIELNAKFISIGLKPNLTCSLVHHAENLSSVPYRFTKEFAIDIKRKKNKKNCYLYVLYKNIKLNMRDKNKKIFNFFLKKNKITQVVLGHGKIYCYSMKKFHLSTMELMKRDIYCWLKTQPKKKHWI